jgi:para-nitrobenzyl esterase
MMNRRCAITSLGTTLLLSSLGQARSSAPPEARTQYGRISGCDDQGIKVFLGIRYGADTGGQNRFMPPQPPTPWTGVHPAVELGNSALQSSPKGYSYSQFHNPFASFRARQPESEDCLFLNVWTPGLRTARKRPVMVWIHPGGFTTGAGCNPATYGRNLAQAGDVVVVSINHRLGALGYFHIHGIAPNLPGSANVAQLDQIAALRWVRENIAEFGGDPNNVTVFGQSGGGAKICTLMAMPAARGLFHRAIVESGIFRKCTDPELATLGAEAILYELGIPRHQGHRIREVPGSDIVSAFFIVSNNNRISGGGLRRAFSPMIDADTVPTHADSPEAHRLSANVPLLIGNTRTETTSLERELAGFDITFEDLEQRYLLWYRTRIDTVALPPERAGQQIATLRQADPRASASDLYYRLTTMLWPTMNTIAYVDQRSALVSAPTYLYEVDFETDVAGGKFHSPHSLEVPLVFRSVAQSPSMYNDTPQAAAMVKQVSPAWSHFAGRGDPNHADLPSWPQYEPLSRSAMIFNLPSHVERDYRRLDRDLLAGLPLLAP